MTVTKAVLVICFICHTDAQSVFRLVNEAKQTLYLIIPVSRLVKAAFLFTFHVIMKYFISIWVLLKMTSS